MIRVSDTSSRAFPHQTRRLLYRNEMLPLRVHTKEEAKISEIVRFCLRSEARLPWSVVPLDGNAVNRAWASEYKR